VPLSPTSESRLIGVYPPLATAIRTLSDMIDPDPIYHLIVTQGLRNWAQQDTLWRKGRDSTGRIVDKAAVVTMAMPGRSWHQFGMAVDVAVGRDVGTGLQWELGSAIWQRVITAGESLGMASGARWTKPVDGPHFQMTGRFGKAPNSEVIYLFKEVGIRGVWEAAFDLPHDEK